MTKRKYQVFVSSTYTDLIEERKEVVQALLENDCIPVGMELFPASNKKQWEIIKSVIDNCDYYLLIIAGRYGSMGIDEEGNKVSYTEMEYDYAVKTGKPIIVFLHKNYEALPHSKCERSKTGENRLINFRGKASNGREVAFWTNKDNLKSAVINSISETKKDYPDGGWVRADEAFLQGIMSNSGDIIDTFSGKWKSTTEQNFEDIEDLVYDPSTHLLRGEIQRIKPEAQNTRKWYCIGCAVGETMVMIYFSQQGHSAGCALLRHHHDKQYRGYYLRFNYGPKEIDKQSVILEKLD